MFVDEIQDLVGVRASLVRAILEQLPGFTLLGDPAQAIYDHQVRDSRDAMSSDEFLAHVRSEHAELRTFTLSENLRQRINVEATDVDRIGAALRVSDPDIATIAGDLAEVYRDLEPLGRFDDLAPALRGGRKRVAVLCRKNVDALRVSRHLVERRVGPPPPARRHRTLPSEMARDPVSWGRQNDLE